MRGGGDYFWAAEQILVSQERNVLQEVSYATMESDSFAIKTHK
jgi:hypothetical protein